MTLHNFSEEALAEIKKYAQGLQSCEATAYNLWSRKLTASFENNPSASDVIVWSIQLGLGLPSESAEEAREKAKQAISYFSNL